MNAADQSERRSRIYDLHRSVHRRNFSGDGAWLGEFPKDSVDDAREWLWHSLAFLAGDDEDVRLGNTLVAATPNNPNHFNPISAALILLRCNEQLDEKAQRHLVQIVKDNYAEGVDFAFAVSGLNNFSAMWAFFHLAASQVMETYEVAYTHKSIPEVYNRFRMRQFGLNTLRIIEQQLQRTDLASEFNSQTYSPIALMHMAEIVNRIDYEPARKIAAGIEGRLWKELLGFHHPLLHHNSGPHSRCYTVGSVGHTSNWRILCNFLGLDGGATVEEAVYRPLDGEVIHACGDLPHQQSITCWLIRPDYHIPDDLLAEFHGRTFPYWFQGMHEWPGKGFRRSDGKLILNVEGDALTDGGTGVARCYQEENFSVGSMEQSYTMANHPCQVVYRLTEGDGPLGSTRSLSTVFLTSSLPETTENRVGKQVAPNILPNLGLFRLQQDRNIVRGTVQPCDWAPHRNVGGCDELSLNLFISEHLPVDRPVETAVLNGGRYEGKPLEQESTTAMFEIEDGMARIVCTIHAKIETRFLIARHGGFLRCAAILYQGEAQMFTPEELAGYGVEFEISVFGAPFLCRPEDRSPRGRRLVELPVGQGGSQKSD
jgi:hypothetical protein